MTPLARYDRAFKWAIIMKNATNCHQNRRWVFGWLVEHMHEDGTIAARTYGKLPEAMKLTALTCEKHVSSLVLTGYLVRTNVGAGVRVAIEKFQEEQTA